MNNIFIIIGAILYGVICVVYYVNFTELRAYSHSFKSIFLKNNSGTNFEEVVNKKIILMSIICFPFFVVISLIIFVEWMLD